MESFGNVKEAFLSVKGRPLYVQAKSDGVYIQTHKVKSQVVLFDEVGRNVTEQFKQLANMVSKLQAHDLILDTEVVGLARAGQRVLSKPETWSAGEKQMLFFDILKLED